MPLMISTLWVLNQDFCLPGLYKVEKWWMATGMSGFKVFKFAMKRCENQEPPVWEQDTQQVMLFIYTL